MKISIVVFMGLWTTLFAGAAQSLVLKENRNFEYELQTTNIFPWINGQKSGRVNDEQGVFAKALDDIMNRAQSHLDLAVYGAEKQQWFFDRLRSLKSRKISMKAVVDQVRGEVGEWKPENFVYPMTVTIPKILGLKSVLPDLDRNMNVRRSSFMHNKFVVVDQQTVWTGSTNISNTCLGAEYNANVSIKVNSPALAGIFSEEFSQMFRSKRFSVRKSTLDEVPKVSYRDGTEVAAFFSPQDSTVDRGILPAIEAADKRIDLAMFFFTHQAIAEALIDAHNRGVTVRMMLDAVAARHPASRHQMLRDAGIEVRVENWGGKMHMKAAAIDNDQTIIGSMNWTKAGDKKNDENTLIISGNRKLNREFSVYFQRLWRTLDHPITRRNPRPEGRDSINSCFDGLDNNHNKLRDAEDPGCQFFNKALL
jgi:phosphatidylserine/phosphatidylglycerophosphate/cardiolipin synthase-like enzyme